MNSLINLKYARNENELSAFRVLMCMCQQTLP